MSKEPALQEVINRQVGVAAPVSSAFRTELAARLRADACAGPRRDRISVRDLLEWAFRDECARLRFDEGMRAAGAPYRGVGIEYLMMQRGATGCRIDGGGVSYPHDDAEIVVDVVASCLDRRMAVWVAALARAGSAPDPMVGVRPRVMPAAWHVNRHGRRPATVDATPYGSPPVPRRNRKGVVVYDKVRVTPVVIRPTVDQIACARRGWLDWWRALFHLREDLRRSGLLTRWELNDVMPPLRPWEEKS